MVGNTTQVIRLRKLKNVLILIGQLVMRCYLLNKIQKTRDQNNVDDKGMAVLIQMSELIRCHLFNEIQKSTSLCQRM